MKKIGGTAQDNLVSRESYQHESNVLSFPSCLFDCSKICGSMETTIGDDRQNRSVRINLTEIKKKSMKKRFLCYIVQLFRDINIKIIMKKNI